MKAVLQAAPFAKSGALQQDLVQALNGDFDVVVMFTRKKESKDWCVTTSAIDDTTLVIGALTRMISELEYRIRREG